ncbi:hypothetical protein KOI35_45150 [Actinoplanes bogorensis]|uniref:Lysine biosynthesis protein LysW n=1 Tax=Paractinoplanes bogorensis TaxID=1610840 RepID=A0ABS5Z513_9ACTN|nr:hypothetical protein [Actinoplanes bogorensis]MBU2670712.1 hypothetical protein [Actinoplanes bogorensis]
MSDHEPRCVICDNDMMFEVPATADGQVEELVCARCGAAEVVAPIVAHLWPAQPRHLPQQRRAA